MTKNKRLWIISLVLVATLCLSLFAVACNNSDDSKKTEITVNPTSVTLEIGGTKQLTASGADSYTWTSANSSIATVSNAGLVTAIAEGSTTITVKSGEATATCAVTVNAPAVVPVIDIDTTAKNFEVGDTFTLAPVLKVNGEVVNDATFTYESSAQEIATVTDSGVITAVSAGNANITVSCTYSGQTDSKVIPVTVIVPTTPVVVEHEASECIACDTASLISTGDNGEFIYNVTSASGMTERFLKITPNEDFAVGNYIVMTCEFGEGSAFNPDVDNRVMYIAENSGSGIYNAFKYYDATTMIEVAEADIEYDVLYIAVAQICVDASDADGKIVIAVADWASPKLTIYELCTMNDLANEEFINSIPLSFDANEYIFCENDDLISIGKNGEFIYEVLGASGITGRFLEIVPDDDFAVGNYMAMMCKFGAGSAFNSDVDLKVMYMTERYEGAIYHAFTYYSTTTGDVVEEDNVEYETWYIAIAPIYTCVDFDDNIAIAVADWASPKLTISGLYTLTPVAYELFIDNIPNLPEPVEPSTAEELAFAENGKAVYSPGVLSFALGNSTAATYTEEAMTGSDKKDGTYKYHTTNVGNGLGADTSTNRCLSFEDVSSKLFVEGNYLVIDFYVAENTDVPEMYFFNNTKYGYTYLDEKGNVVAEADVKTGTWYKAYLKIQEIGSDGYWALGNNFLVISFEGASTVYLASVSIYSQTAFDAEFGANA